jgi:hypothetical protein
MSMKQEPRSEWERDPDSPEVTVFESFARSAGASLRSEAPEEGMTAVARRGNRQKARRVATEVGVVVALILSGIAVFTHFDSSRHNVNVRPVDTVETPTPSSVAGPILSADDPLISQWFLDYTGNPVGPTSGDPVKFGVVMPSLVYQYGLAAASYLNEQAGGVGGRPIVVDPCTQSTTECADRFAADPAIVAVLENEWSGDSFGDALGGRKPLHTTYSGSGTTGVGYYPTYRETVTAMALQAEKLTRFGSRVLVIDGVDHPNIQPGSPNNYVIPDLTSSLAGRVVSTVQATTTKSLADTIRGANATDATAIILAIPPLEQLQVHPISQLICDALANAVDELAIQPAVIVDGCDAHDGWYKVDVGYNETSPTLESGALPIASKMPVLGKVETAPEARATREIGALLAVIRVINQLGGPAQATPAALDRALRDFTGPVPFGAGRLNCSPTGKVAERVPPGSCVQFVDVHQFVRGAWVDLAPIDLGA